MPRVTRYYSASNGEITVFRASVSRVYHSVEFRRFGWTFRSNPAHIPKSYPAIEISRAQYEILHIAKNTSLREVGKNPRDYATPAESFVPNWPMPLRAA